MVMMVKPKGCVMRYAVWENQKSWEDGEKPVAVGDSVKVLVKKYPKGMFGAIWVKENAK